MLAYRWEHTDAALAEQLALEAEGEPVTIEPGHAAVRYCNPTTGGDVLPTMRAEFHPLAAGAQTAVRQETGSSVFQVFAGSGEVMVGAEQWSVEPGDLFVVPSREPFAASTDAGVDLFRFGDAPVFEALHLQRERTRRPGDVIATGTRRRRGGPRLRDIWHVDGLARRLRNELFADRRPDDVKHVDWLYGS